MKPSLKVVMIAGALLSLGGCGNPDTSSSTATGLVKGKVTLAGKPLAKTEIQFNPSNVNRKSAPVVTVAVKEDGTYEVTTLVGQNQVSLTGPGVAKVPQLAYFTKTIDVQTGTNDMDIILP